MRSMLIGCALLAFGSCAALAQQDPTPAQGGSPTAPAPAAPTGAAAAPMAAPSDGAMMKKPMMHHKMKMHHKKKMMHHRKMMMHHGMMMKKNNDAITGPGAGHSHYQTK